MSHRQAFWTDAADRPVGCAAEVLDQNNSIAAGQPPCQQNAIFFAQVAEITPQSPAILSRFGARLRGIRHDRATPENDTSRALVVVQTGARLA